MTVRIGDIAPDFIADSTQGTISFHKWIDDSWAFFFSHPADFTPVCTTEMARTAQLINEFNTLNIRPIGLSTDTLEDHKRWLEEVNNTQHTDLTFPIIADPTLRVCRIYDMIHPTHSETKAVRSVFIIDQKKRIRLTMAYPMSVGRNFDEILRVVDALQFSDAQNTATPADWLPGCQISLPTVKRRRSEKWSLAALTHI